MLGSGTLEMWKLQVTVHNSLKIHKHVTRDRPPPRSPQAKYDFFLQLDKQYFDEFMPEGHLGLIIVYITKLNTIHDLIHENFWYAIVVIWVSLYICLASSWPLSVVRHALMALVTWSSAHWAVDQASSVMKILNAVGKRAIVS